MFAARQAERPQIERANPAIGMTTPARMQRTTLRLIVLSIRWHRAERAGDLEIIEQLADQALTEVLDAANLLRVNLDARIAPGAAPLSAERFLEVVSSMSKAAEALDHLEDYPSRPVFEQALLDLAAGLGARQVLEHSKAS
jgi:hypothetical protein